jgi:acyl-CoA:acyl-CoA alkyltransferase
MAYQRVCLEALSYVLPDERISSVEIEDCLMPLYERLRLPEGRLALMTGIEERRFFPRGTRPSQISALCGARLLEASGIDPREIGALVHGSVCRDFLEPATACGVHHALGLPPQCHVYDVSNACLGLLTGMVQVANLIELGFIRAGIVVGAELGRDLVETTIAHLNTDESLTRRDVKKYFASLTIGSAGAAMLLCDRELSQTQNRLVDVATLANTQNHELCQSDGLTAFMETDSETLLHAGIATAVDSFDLLLKKLGWSRAEVSKTICHQVGTAHRNLLLEALELSPEGDFSTFEKLGNTGAAALPLTLAMAAEQGRLTGGERVALLGIGSGINCQMAGIEWRETRVVGGDAMLVTPT